ncbi:hypothetical protein C5167_021412 [Papaver somniferum]|nr:hypothetical protein C5167_021412 [Papaver somniferum]
MAASCSSYSLTQISAASFSNSTMSSKRLPSSSYIRAGTKFPPKVPKELHFNHDGSATKKLQAGVDMVADLVGVTLGPKGRNVVLQNKYGTPKIVNDGVTVLKQIQLEDPLENVGAKLVRQAGAKTKDLAGDGSTTSAVLAQGLIAEGLKVLLVDKNIVYPRELFKGSIEGCGYISTGFWRKKDISPATVVRDEVGLVLKDVGKEVLGNAIKVVVTKDPTMIVSDGSNQSAVNERVAQLRNLVRYEHLVSHCINFGFQSSNVGAQTVVELKDKQLRIEDALNATKAAIEEGVVVGGGFCMLRLSQKIDDIKKKLENDEQKAVPHFLYLAGIIDPSKVVRCCLEHASSVAHTFLTSDLVVVEIEELIPRMPRMRTPMPTSGIPTRMRKPMPTSGVGLVGLE